MPTTIMKTKYRRSSWRRSGKPERLFFFPEGRTYSPPAKQAVVFLPLVGLVRSSRSVYRTFLQRGQAMLSCQMASVIIACTAGSQLALHLRCSRKSVVPISTTCHPPAKTCRKSTHTFGRGRFIAVMDDAADMLSRKVIPCIIHFLLSSSKETKIDCQ